MKHQAHARRSGRCGCRGRGAQDIVLYQGENFSGPRFASNESVADLARVGFNDRASSVTIRGGSWQLCSDSYYRGQCVTLQPGDYPSLGAMGLDNAVSSLREIGWNGGGGGPGRRPGRRRTRRRLDRAVRAPGMTGRSLHAERADRRTSTAPASTIAPSAIVNSGTWQLCADAEFTRALRSARARAAWSNLGGVTGRVSSVRPMPRRRRRRRRGPGRRGGGNWGGGRTRVVLYEGPNFQGRVVHRERRMSSSIWRRPASTTARRRCASSAATGCSAPTPISWATAGRSGRATIRRCRGSPTASRRDGASPTTIRTTRRRAWRSCERPPAMRCHRRRHRGHCAASSRSRARSPSSGCRRTGTGRATSPRSTCRTRAIA